MVRDVNSQQLITIIKLQFNQSERTTMGRSCLPKTDYQMLPCKWRNHAMSGIHMMELIPLCSSQGATWNEPLPSQAPMLKSNLLTFLSSSSADPHFCQCGSGEEINEWKKNKTTLLKGMLGNGIGSCVMPEVPVHGYIWFMMENDFFIQQHNIW